MLGKLRNFLACLSIIGVLCFAFALPAQAAAYGQGDYGACAYQSDCPASGATPSSGAPNTGVEQKDLLLPIATGLVGAALVAYVVIKYLKRAKHKK